MILHYNKVYILMLLFNNYYFTLTIKNYKMYYVKMSMDLLHSEIYNLQAL